MDYKAKKEDEESKKLFNSFLCTLIGVASGKCGFTTIRNFQYKKPDFPSPKLRN
ncbi:hypothetical protein PDQ69_24485 [Bacillus cereus group sp. Bc062]|uniref:hypothetical protein n=1 Tax=Bacillus cereus group sp. Bc062 TaxID=3018116 RepID=UPI00147D9301|nr:hypothetical protein [Bacillus cereus group sp. Bc062]MDA2588269.1 hypothetical protein [Bacillus cereus group sp. Bc062]